MGRFRKNEAEGTDEQQEVTKGSGECIKTRTVRLCGCKGGEEK